jgi:gliding motility-associated-like protein
VTCTISPEADVTYSWELGDGTTETGSTIKHAYQLTIKDFQYKITLTATNKNGCVKTGSKNIEVNPLIPNVFSPNGDGIDDIFMKGVDLQIFDRLGIILYNGNTGWDGTYHGQQVKVDTYFYYIKLNDNDQNQRTFKGYLTLIR